jgi:hypothetical protein
MECCLMMLMFGSSGRATCLWVEEWSSGLGLSYLSTLVLGLSRVLESGAGVVWQA